MGMNGTESNEGFPSAWDAGQKNQSFRPFGGGPMDDVFDFKDGRIGGRSGAMDGSDFMVIKKLSCCLDERRQRAICRFSQKSLRGKRGQSGVMRQVIDKPVDGIWAKDMDIMLTAQVTPGFHGDT